MNNLNHYRYEARYQQNLQRQRIFQLNREFYRKAENRINLILFCYKFTRKFNRKTKKRIINYFVYKH